MGDVTIAVMRDNEEDAGLYEYIENAPGGTIFHHPKFLSYHRPETFPHPDYSVHHMIFYKKRKIAGFLPGYIKNEKGRNAFYSPFGASFGGIVTTETSFKIYERMVEVMLDHLTNAENVGEINLTPATRIYMGENGTDYFNYILLSKKFIIQSYEMCIFARIRRDDGFLANTLKPRVKRKIAESNRLGLRCRISHSHEISYPIIEENQKKFDKKPTHTFRELNEITRLFPDRMLNFVAYQNDSAIAAVTLILCNKETAYSFYIAHLDEHAHCRPVDFLFGQIMTWLKDNGYRYLDFGPSTFGAAPHHSLIFFKEGFGGTGVNKYSYRYLRGDLIEH